MTVQVPTFIPLPDAARKYNISENVLTQLIQDGRIDAAQLPSGELVVSDNDLNQTKMREQIIAEHLEERRRLGAEIRAKFEHLRRQPINASEAARKYSIAQANFSHWAKAGFIRKLPGTHSRLLLLDEADVAYCAEVYRRKKAEYGGGLAGVRIFDEEGNPYTLLYPERSVLNRRNG